MSSGSLGPLTCCPHRRPSSPNSEPGDLIVVMTVKLCALFRINHVPSPPRRATSPEPRAMKPGCAAGACSLSDPRIRQENAHTHRACPHCLKSRVRCGHVNAQDRRSMDHGPWAMGEGHEPTLPQAARRSGDGQSCALIWVCVSVNSTTRSHCTCWTMRTMRGKRKPAGMQSFRG